MNAYRAMLQYSNYALGARAKSSNKSGPLNFQRDKMINKKQKMRNIRIIWFIQCASPAAAPLSAALSFMFLGGTNSQIDGPQSFRSIVEIAIYMLTFSFQWAVV